jgi:hypothetical protein
MSKLIVFYIHLTKLSVTISLYSNLPRASLLGGLLLKTATLISFRDHAQREDALNGDLPTIPLTVIEQITDNFSELSKLGEGGFGPVYKV